MPRFLLLLVFILLTFSCSTPEDSNSDTDMGPDRSSEPESNRGGGDCNMAQIVCPEGYQESWGECGRDLPCKPSLSGECLDAADCICLTSCDEVYASSCDGVLDCVEKDACGRPIYCAACAEQPECGDREELQFSCPPEGACREVACTSDPAVSVQCVATDPECEMVVCPDGMRACDSLSATCAETATCAELRLCEPDV